MNKIYTDFVKDISGQNPLSLKKLKGDASERMYFRVTMPDNKSFILMQDTENAEKNSILNNICLTEILEKNNVRVPQIIGKCIERNLLLLEDAGDVSLYDAVKNDNKKLLPFYQKAIDQMIAIHKIVSDDQSPCFKLSFDTEKLMWELDFFIEHLQKIKEPLPKKLLADIHPIFTEICRKLSADANVLTHRDYHCRNIMIKDNEPVIIDFQDARMGSRTYDLTSLLKDSYIDLDQAIVDKLLEYYFTKQKLTKEHQENFIDIFKLMTFQRSLKACGSFCYLDFKTKNFAYMASFPKALSYAREAISDTRYYTKPLKDFFKTVENL